MNKTSRSSPQPRLLLEMERYQNSNAWASVDRTVLKKSTIIIMCRKVAVRWLCSCWCRCRCYVLNCAASCSLRSVTLTWSWSRSTSWFEHGTTTKIFRWTKFLLSSWLLATSCGERTNCRSMHGDLLSHVHYQHHHCFSVKFIFSYTMGWTRHWEILQQATILTKTASFLCPTSHPLHHITWA